MSKPPEGENIDHPARPKGADPAVLAKILETECSSEVIRNYTRRFFLQNQTSYTEAEEFRKRITFIQRNIPEEVLQRRYPYDGVALTILLERPTSFLTALRTRFSDDEWSDLLKDTQRMKELSKAGYRDPYWEKVLHEEDVPEFANRDSVPIKAVKGMEDRLPELQEVLDMSGIGEMAIPLAKDITFAEPEGGNHTRGHFGKRHSDITVSTAGDGRFLLPSSLLHELGHAMMMRTNWDEDALDVLDEYKVASQFEEMPLSPYAMSFMLSEKDTFGAGTYISEAFAEDFRIYWLMPEELSASKRSVFDRLCDKYLPNINREETRNKIVTTLGSLYGKSVRQSIDRSLKKSIREIAEEKVNKNKRK